jgi:hypothetical protein
MFSTRKCIVLLHLGGKVIRTTADHPFCVGGQGGVNAADIPGAKSDGEQEVVYHLNLGQPAMPDQPRPSYPIVNFVAGVPFAEMLAAITLEMGAGIRPFQVGKVSLVGEHRPGPLRRAELPRNGRP